MENQPGPNGTPYFFERPYHRTTCEGAEEVVPFFA